MQLHYIGERKDLNKYNDEFEISEKGWKGGGEQEPYQSKRCHHRAPTLNGRMVGGEGAH